MTAEACPAHGQERCWSCNRISTIDLDDEGN